MGVEFKHPQFAKLHFAVMHLICRLESVFYFKTVIMCEQSEKVKALQAPATDSESPDEIFVKKDGEMLKGWRRFHRRY